MSVPERPSWMSDATYTEWIDYRAQGFNVLVRQTQMQWMIGDWLYKGVSLWRVDHPHNDSVNEAVAFIIDYLDADPELRNRWVAKCETAMAWPVKDRTKASFMVHQELRNYDKRKKVIRDDMLVSEARLIVRPVRDRFSDPDASQVGIANVIARLEGGTRFARYKKSDRKVLEEASTNKLISAFTLAEEGLENYEWFVATIGELLEERGG